MRLKILLRSETTKKLSKMSYCRSVVQSCLTVVLFATVFPTVNSSCPAPVVSLQNSQIPKDGFETSYTDGSTVVHACRGMAMFPDLLGGVARQYQCKDSGWTGVSFPCQNGCSSITPPDALVVDYSNNVDEDSTYPVDTLATFSCLGQASVQGSASAICTPTLAWTDIPSCACTFTSLDGLALGISAATCSKSQCALPAGQAAIVPINTTQTCNSKRISFFGERITKNGDIEPTQCLRANPQKATNPDVAVTLFCSTTGVLTAYVQKENRRTVTYGRFTDMSCLNGICPP